MKGLGGGGYDCLSPGEYGWDEVGQRFACPGAGLDYEVVAVGDGLGDHPRHGLLTGSPFTPVGQVGTGIF